MQVNVHGTDRSASYLKDELEQVGWRAQADDGGVGQQTVPIPDPLGSQTPVAGQKVEFIVGSDTLFAGFIGPLQRERGAGMGGRLLNQFTVGDENAVLHGMLAYKWVRPSESTRTRFLAFLTDFVPWVTDTTWVTTGVTATMPAKTYTTETLFQELYDEIKDLTGNAAFVENHRAHLHPYDIGVTGGLAFTDVATAWDATHLPIMGEPRRSKDPIDLRTKVRVVSPSATAVATDGTAQGLYDADGVVHEALVQLDSGNAAAVTAKATQILTDKKRERITYEFDFGPISAADLALIPVGSLITVTSSVLGLTASTQRIAAMTVKYVHPDRFKGTIETGYPIRQRKSSPRTVPNVCCPPWDGVGSPSAGQDVINELAWTGDGVTLAGITDFPYIGGSLAVWVAGLNVTGYKTEVDPTTGDFNLSFAPTLGQTVRVNYTAA